MQVGFQSLNNSDAGSEDQSMTNNSRLLDGVMPDSMGQSYLMANKDMLDGGYADKTCNGHIKAQKYKAQVLYIPIPVINNLGLEIYPSEIHFKGFALGIAQTCTLKITNVSNTAQKIGIFATDNDNFEFQFSKKGNLAKGADLNVTVKFIANTYQAYETILRIQHAKAWLTIPIKAYPSITYQRESIFPKTISFQWREISQTHVISRRIESFTGVDCSYEIVTTNSCDQISIVPEKGIIPANGFAEIQFCFRPELSITPIHRLEANVSSLVGH
jgi:hypothetical protein